MDTGSARLHWITQRSQSFMFLPMDCREDGASSKFPENFQVEFSNLSPCLADGTAVGSGMPYLSPSNAAGHALSLLSPKASSSWASSDLSSQSSAALRELIAENRAAILAGQLLLDRGTWHGASPGAQVVFSIAPQQQQQQPLPLTLPPQLEDGWDHLRTPGAQVTLDLMQTPSSSIEILSGRSRSKEGDEECCDIWKSLEGTHVV